MNMLEQAEAMKARTKQFAIRIVSVVGLCLGHAKAM